MWILSAYNQIRLGVNRRDNPSILHYNGLFYYILRVWAYKGCGPFIYTSKHLAATISHLSLEFRNVRFKYIGKAYRISKRRKILALNLHYPTFKYLIWRNIKLYHKKKRRKVFKIKYHTSGQIKLNLYQNLLRWRIPDTYTKRGIPNNVFALNVRKQRAATGR